MPKLPNVTGTEIVAALRRAGFYVSTISGSHWRMRRDDGRRTSVAVHAGESVAKGTVRQILRDAGLTVEKSIRLLK